MDEVSGNLTSDPTTTGQDEVRNMMASPDSDNSSDILNDNINSSFSSQDSLSQDTKDILFDAGYTISEIQSILINSKSTSTLDESISNESELETDLDTTESRGQNVNSLLKKIRIKNMNRLIIGTLNIYYIIL